MATKQIYTLDDLYAARATSVVELGLENVLNSLVAYGNFLVEDTSEQLNLFSEETTNAREFWGGVGRISFEELGEFGQAETQRDIKDQEVQFPLRKIGAASGWSKEFFKRAKGAEIRKIMLDMDNAYNQRIRDEIKTAIFKPTATQWQSSIYPQDGVLTKIQPFLNADGGTIPDAPNGAQFVGASHNHYLGTTGSSIASEDVNYLLGHVREHVVGEVALFVDPAMPATLSGLASTKFVALTPSVLVNQTASQVAIATFNPAGDRSNMFVGYWDGYAVYTRSWCPTGYLAALGVGAPDKPLKRRVDPAFRGMQTDGVVTNGQIVAQEFYDYMGFGAFNRAAGAVLDSTHQATYSAPSGLLR